MSEDEQLVRAFYTAALFLIDRVKREGWYWTSNYLREHARATTGLRFSNSRSPHILRQLVKKHPELTGWVALKPLTRVSPDSDLFKRIARAAELRSEQT